MNSKSTDQHHREVAERFKRETANHEMTVLHDDGLYRHLRFMNPKYSAYWFDLITVPGALIFQGDGETFAFRRIKDMFEFFRGPVGNINPDYWAEKLTSDRDSVVTYSQALFDQHVAADLKEAEEWFPGVTEAWKAQTEGFSAEYTTEYEHDAYRALHAFEYLPEGQYGNAFSFVDTDDWQLKDYDWWFLWACHGIVWGVAQYDASKKANAELDEAAR